MRAIRRGVLCLSTVYGALATALVAHAQQEQEQAAGTQVEEVVVYGQALSTARAIAAKRESGAVLDAVTQDDMGRLPDINTAQAILRLPGVAVQNDQGEARFPIIRGLNATYNRTTIDGGIVASPERGGLGRAVPLDLIPAALLSRIEVRKTITPDLDHNAIGGTINLVTRSAFDQEAPFLIGSVFIGEHEQSGEGGTLEDGREVTPWRATLAAGRRFGQDEQLGATIGLAYSIRNFEIPQIEVDDADYTEFDNAGNNVGLGNGNGRVVPTNNRQFFYNNVRERIGANVKLEWRPSEALHLDLAATYNEYNDSERRDEQRYELGTSGSVSEPARIRAQTATTGITDTGFNTIGIGRFVLDRDITSLRGGVDWQLAPAWNLSGGAVYSTAELTNPEITESFVTGTDFGARYDTSTFFPQTTPLNPEGFFDPANYAHTSRGVLDRFSEDDILEMHGDLEWTLVPERLTLKAGALLRGAEKSEGFSFERFTAADSTGYTLADVADGALAGVDFQGGYFFPTRIDLGASDAFFADNAFESAGTSSSGSEASEDVTAGYLMATWKHDAWTVIGGARLERTSWDGAPRGGEQVSGEYTNVLPSVNLRYALDADIVLRAAVSQTLGRPDLNLLTRGVDIDTAANTISRSNPDLDPRLSTNFDLSAEWYIRDGILALGAFHKDIDDEIFVVTRRGAITVGGTTYDAVTQPENARSARITGIEAQYQQSLRFLPDPFDGFGVLANVTLLDTAFRVPLSDGGSRETGFFQQPDTTYNLTGFYASDFAEIRVSYNYTDRFIDSITPDDPSTDEYWDERSQVDMQVRLNLTRRIALIGEVQNLTDQGRTELAGPGAGFLQEDAEFGRTFWLGVNAHL